MTNTNFNHSLSNSLPSKASEAAKAKPEDTGKLSVIYEIFASTTVQELKFLIGSFNLEQVTAWQDKLSKLPTDSEELKAISPTRRHQLLQILLEAKVELTRQAGQKASNKISSKSHGQKGYKAQRRPSSESILGSSIQVCLKQLSLLGLQKIADMDAHQREQLLENLSQSELLYLVQQIKESASIFPQLTDLSSLVMVEIEKERVGRVAKTNLSQASDASETAIQGQPQDQANPRIVQMWTKILHSTDTKELSKRTIRPIEENPKIASIRERIMNALAWIGAVIWGLIQWLWPFSARRSQSVDPAHEALALEVLRLPDESINLTKLIDKARERVENYFKNDPTGRFNAERRVRLGFTVASSIVSHQKERVKIADAISETREERLALRNYIANSNLPSTDTDFLEKSNIFREGGNPIIATELELQAISRIIDEQSTSRIGPISHKKPKNANKQLSKSDLTKLYHYKENLERSHNLNLAIFEAFIGYNSSIKSFLEWFNEFRNTASQQMEASESTSQSLEKLMAIASAAIEYCEDPFKKAQDVDHLVEQWKQLNRKEILELEQSTQDICATLGTKLQELADMAHEFEENPKKIAQEVLNQCKKLQEGQGLYLDSFVEYHAMRLAVKKEKGEFVITIYDSSGGLERSSLSNSIGGLVHLGILEGKLPFISNQELAPRSNALQIRVPESKLYIEGKQYFADLLELGTGRSMHEQKKIQEKIQSESTSSFLNTAANLLGFGINLGRQQARRWLYLHYIEKFSAIATADSPPEFLPIKQAPQITNDCYAQRIQTNQFYELGIPLSKKLRQSFLVEQRADILDQLNPEKNPQSPIRLEAYDDIKRPPVMRTADELKNIARRLVHLSSIPSEDYFRTYIQHLQQQSAHLKELLKTYESGSNQQRETQLALHAIENQLHVFYKDFYNHLISKRLKIDDYLECDATSSKLALKNNAKSLDELAKFLCEQSWKDIVSMLNHNIMRLNTERRYLEDVKDRLPKASLTEAKTASIDDLKSANIVSYIQGIKRQKVYAIELDINGERREISYKDYFTLLAATPEALSDPNVVEITQFLRSHNPEMRIDFEKLIFEPQIQAFIRKNNTSFDRAINQYRQALSRNKEKKLQLEKAIEAIQSQRQSVHQKISNINPSSEHPSGDLPRLEILQKHSYYLETTYQQLNFLKDHTEAMTAILKKTIASLENKKEETSRKILNDPNLAPVISSVFLESQETVAKLQEMLERQLSEQDQLEDTFYLSTRFRSRLFQDEILELSMKTHSSTRLLYKLVNSSSRPHKAHRLAPRDESTDNLLQKNNRKIFNSTKEWFKQVLEDRENEMIAQANLESNPVSLDTARFNELHSIWRNLQTEEIDAVIELGLPQDDCKQWHDDIIQLWMNKENPSTLQKLLKLPNQQEALQKAFVQWVETHSKLRQIDFEMAGLSLEINEEAIQAFKSRFLDREVENQNKAATVIQRFIRKRQNIKAPRASLRNQPQPTASITRQSIQDSRYRFQALPYNIRGGLSTTPSSLDHTNTLRLLQGNPKPVVPHTGSDSHTVLQYYQQAKGYFELLCNAKELEFCQERLQVLALEVAQVAIQNPHLPIDQEFAHALIQEYFSRLVEQADSAQEAIAHLNNDSLKDLLKVVLLTSLATIAPDENANYHVPNSSYSMLMQWIQLFPEDSSLQKCKELLIKDPNTLDDNLPWKFISEIGNLVRQSPIGLEAIDEGSSAIQDALFQFQKETGEAYNLRNLADRWNLRESRTLSPHIFLNYYQNLDRLFEDSSLATSHGREYFERSFHAALAHANETDKERLLSFLKTAIDHVTQNSQPSLKPMRLSMRLFLIEQLAKVSSNIPGDHLKETEVAEYELQISKQISSLKSEETLLGLAWRISWTLIKLEKALKETPCDKTTTDRLLAEIACTRLWFEELYQEVPENVKDSFTLNKEFHSAFERMKHQMQAFQTPLQSWIQKLPEDEQASSTLHNLLSEQIREGHLDATLLKATQFQSSQLYGFIQLSPSIQWDVHHGALYFNGYRTSQLGAEVRAHPSVVTLGLQNLPFERVDLDWVYREADEPRILILPRSDGSVIIQRHLRTIDGASQWLEYAGLTTDLDLPKSLAYQLGATQFWWSSDGNLHGLDSDYQPLFSVKPQLSGSLQVHFANSEDTYRTITSDDLADPKVSEILLELSKIASLDEILAKEGGLSFTIPRLKLSVTLQADGNKSYWICQGEKYDGLELIPDNNSGLLLGRVLTSEQKAHLDELLNNRSILQTQLDQITEASLVTEHKKKKILEALRQNENEILRIQGKVLLVANDPAAEQSHLDALRANYNHAQMNAKAAYQNFISSSKEELSTAWSQYAKALIQLQESTKNICALHADEPSLASFEQQTDQHWSPTNLISAISYTLFSETINYPLLISWLKKSDPFKIDDKTTLSLQKLLERLRNDSLSSAQTQQATIAIHLFLLARATNLRQQALSQGGGLPHEFIAENKAKILSLLKNYSSQEKHLLHDLNDLWSNVQSEFVGFEEYNELFHAQKRTVISGLEKPELTFDLAQATSAPAYNLGIQHFLHYVQRENPITTLESSQIRLMERLGRWADDKPAAQVSIYQQESGFFLEDLGLFNNDSLQRYLGVSPTHHGIGGLTANDTRELVDWMKNRGWILDVPATPKRLQINGEPKNWFSRHELETYFIFHNRTPEQARALCWKMEQFFSQVALASGTYKIEADKIDSCESQLHNQIKLHQQAYLEAEDNIRQSLEVPLDEMTWQMLRIAYQTDDYNQIAHWLKADNDQQLKHNMLRIKNSMTRWLYHQTEEQHLQDIAADIRNNPDRATKLLQTRRNYPLADLLQEPPTNDREIKQYQFNQKMLRTFLLFEWQFGHRCNIDQVNIFKGLMLDDNSDPEKIDAAQARMGFGKTALQPLLALFKADGSKLVRFIVPKSALETNASDLSKALEKTLGKRAIIDHFSRYQIPAQDSGIENQSTNRLAVLRNIGEDLRKRLDLYMKVQRDGCVLIQAPYVRNALEDQLKIFLDLLPKLPNAEEQAALSEAIACLNAIRSMKTISIFDELDATQDPLATDVNYTIGEKLPIDSNQILPLELIVGHILSSEAHDPKELASELLALMGIEDADGSIAHYISSKQANLPKMEEIEQEKRESILLCRAVLCEGSMIDLIREKEPGTDYGVWFQKRDDGTHTYDQIQIASHQPELANQAITQPLLIAVPYSAANEPKPRGSRFDNPQVTAITTLRYYLDSRTNILNNPHLSYVITNLRDQTISHLLSHKISSEFLNELISVGNIEDTLARSQAQSELFNRINSDSSRLQQLRVILARLVIANQVQIDTGKARSDRYELGNLDDQLLGFSGTAGDTSFLFRCQQLDPAADGKVMLGIMARENNQHTFKLELPDSNTPGFTLETYNTELIQSLLKGRKENTRVLIDVGGQCKASNQSIARILLNQLHQNGIKGIVFFDDVTNTKKILRFDNRHNFIVEDATLDKLKQGAADRSLFTFYDQAHSRGADILQPDNCHAIMAMGFGVTLNDYKQAFLRLRKIVDPSLRQSISIAIPTTLLAKIANDLQMDNEEIQGNDLVFWLRTQELQNAGSREADLLSQELRSITRNCALHAQAKIFELVYKNNFTTISVEHQQILADYIQKLNQIHNWIDTTQTNLMEMYGRSISQVSKEEFLEQQQQVFRQNIASILHETHQVALQLNIDDTAFAANKERYEKLAHQAVEMRKDRIPSMLEIPNSLNVMSEAHVEVQVQAQAQAQSESIAQVQSQAQAHSFAQVQADDPLNLPRITLPRKEYPKATLDFLKAQDPILVANLSHFRNLFKDSGVLCSQAYVRKHAIASAVSDPLPPVRFVLIQTDADPALDSSSISPREGACLQVKKIFLVSQEEADLFHQDSEAYPQWRLLDLYDYNSLEKQWPAVNSFTTEDSVIDRSENFYAMCQQNSDLKRVLFAAYRYSIDKVDSLTALAQELTGICKQEDLYPHLIIKGQQESASLLRFDRWGFGNAHNRTFQLHLKPTRRQAARLSLGDTSLLITNSLRNRALRKLQDPISEGLWTKMQRDIQQELKQAESERQAAQEQLEKLKSERQVKLSIAALEISASEEPKRQSIEEGRLAFKEAFKRENKVSDPSVVIERLKKQLERPAITPLFSEHTKMKLRQKIGDSIAESALSTFSDLTFKSPTFTELLDQLKAKHAGDMAAVERDLSDLKESMKAIYPNNNKSLDTVMREMAKKQVRASPTDKRKADKLNYRIEAYGGKRIIEIERDVLPHLETHVTLKGFYEGVLDECEIELTTRTAKTPIPWYNLDNWETALENQIKKHISVANKSKQGQVRADLDHLLHGTFEDWSKQFDEAVNDWKERQNITEKIKKFEALRDAGSAVLRMFNDYDAPLDMEVLTSLLKPEKLQEFLKRRKLYQKLDHALLQNYPSPEERVLKPVGAFDDYSTDGTYIRFLGEDKETIPEAVRDALRELDKKLESIEEARSNHVLAIQNQESLYHEAKRKCKTTITQLNARISQLRNEETSLAQLLQHEREMYQKLAEAMVNIEAEEEGSFLEKYFTQEKLLTKPNETLSAELEFEVPRFYHVREDASMAAADCLGNGDNSIEISAEKGQIEAIDFVQNWARRIENRNARLQESFRP